MPGGHNHGMDSKRLEDLLIAQIQNELSAHQHYFGITLYFERESLHKWGGLFKEQSIEEAGHASKIMKFLTDVNVEFDLPALHAATTHYASAVDAVKSALAAEQKVTADFKAMAKVALEDGDYTGFQFVQWFIDEQVEEESKMRGLLDLLAAVPNPFEAELHLEKFGD